MSSNHYVSIADGACHSTRNLSFIALASYDSNGELVKLQGICLGWTTNNHIEYSAVIELLSKAISLGIRELILKLDSQPIVL